MSTSDGNELTPFGRYFLEPRSPTHRQYEALRAYFVEQRPSNAVAADFGYTPGSFRVLCSQFRKSPDREFFLSPNRGPQEAPKRDPLRDTVVAARKQNMSIYDIVDALKKEGKELSPAGVWKILTEEGFARLPRRRDEERPPGVRVTAGEVADVRQLDLTPRTFRTQFGGLFLFVPLLVSMDLDNLLEAAGFPGSAMVPAGNAVRSLLGLKLFGKARNSHIMSHVLDEGLALFAGLTMIPKRSFLTEYSCRIGPESHVQLMRRWFGAVGGLGLEWGSSFDLDFHTIPFHGEDALIEKHYVSKRSRRQKGVLAFLARDADRQVFCYANGDLRIGEQNDEVLRFVEFWKELTGHYPEEVIFDSKLTTYANLSWLNQHDIKFMTLRRRSKKLMEAVRQAPPSAWRRIELDRITRAYRTPRVLDESITLAGYDGPLRQLAIADLGHEEPTLLLTNQLKRSAAKLVGRYAGRVLIENGIADGIDFFHMDALSSAVAMKVDCDLLLTLMASSLYRLFGTQIGRGYETAKSRRIFRDFIDASATVTVTNEEVRVRFQKRAHNPLLMAAGFQETDVHVPWLGGRRLRLILGERRGVNSQN